MRGKRVRTPGAVWTEEAEALGMTPTDVAFLELYQALQQGVVDCIVMNPEALDFGLLEVAPHYTPIPFSAGATLNLAISKSAWDSLPEDAQAILHAAGATFSLAYLEESLGTVGDVAEAVDTQGVQFHEADQDVLAALQEHQERHAGDITAAAPDGISDPEAFVSEYRATLSDWRSFLTEDLGIESPSGSLQETFASVSDLPLDEIKERLDQVYAESAE